jgi:DNA-binding CsgD family transcriptional regulator
MGHPSTVARGLTLVKLREILSLRIPHSGDVRFPGCILEQKIMSFSEVVSGVYRAGTQREAWQRALGLLAAHCSASSALMMVHERHTDRLQFCLEHGLSERARSRLSEVYRFARTGALRRADLRLRDLLSQPVGCVRTDTMLSDYEAYVASDAYRQIYSSLGTEHAMGGFVQETDGRAVAVRLFRSRRQGAFRSADVRRYEQLLPHLAQSVLLAQTQIRASLLTQLLSIEGVLPGHSFCLVDDRGEVLLQAGDGASLLSIDQGAGRAVLGRLRDHDQTQRLCLHDGRELIGQTLAQTRYDAVPGIGADLYLLVAHGEQSPAWRAQRMATRFGLTGAETRLLVALCSGSPPSLTNAARELGIGRETAKTQLACIFQKTGVHRHVDLMRKVMLSA